MVVRALVAPQVEDYNKNSGACNDDGYGTGYKNMRMWAALTECESVADTCMCFFSKEDLHFSALFLTT